MWRDGNITNPEHTFRSNPFSTQRIPQTIPTVSVLTEDRKGLAQAIVGHRTLIVDARFSYEAPSPDGVVDSRTASS